MVDESTKRVRQLGADETIPTAQLANALRVVLSGLATGGVADIEATDTILQALGKLQAQASNKVDKVAGKVLSSNDFTNAERVKLTNIAEQATKNSSDAALRDRATHTGTQAISTVSGLQAALDTKETPAGALAQMQGFGLGVISLPNTLTNLDAANIASGFYRVVPATTGTKPAGAPNNGVVEVIRFNDLDCRQIYYGIGTSSQGKGMWLRHIAWNGTTSLPTPWLELARTDSPAFTGAVTVGTTSGQPTSQSLSVGSASGKSWSSNSNIKLQVESSGISGINIIAGNAAQARLWFSDTDQEQRGRILYDHANDTFLFQSGGGGIRLLDAYSQTTASAANVFVDPSGFMQRSTSSAKYKAEIEPVDAALMQRVIDEARPVWYRSTCAADPADFSYWGLIAEQLGEIDPRFVHWAHPMKTVERQETFEERIDTGEVDDDGQPIFRTELRTETIEEQVPDTDAPLQAEGVMYERLVVPLLWHAQKTQGRVDALEQRLAALEAK